MDEIAMVLRQRQPLYAKSADMAVDTEGKTPEQVAEFIVNEFKRGS
jgi:shikimate kinase